eukprot:scaffold38671_cov57-Phaeocystis_antarctica.AAC.6
MPTRVSTRRPRACCCAGSYRANSYRRRRSRRHPAATRRRRQSSPPEAAAEAAAAAGGARKQRVDLGVRVAVEYTSTLSMYSGENGPPYSSQAFSNKVKRTSSAQRGAVVIALDVISSCEWRDSEVSRPVLRARVSSSNKATSLKLSYVTFWIHQQHLKRQGPSRGVEAWPCGGPVEVDDERGGAAAGAGGGSEAGRGQEQDGLLRRVPRLSESRPTQALPGAGVSRPGRQESESGQLRHRRGGGVVHRAVAGGAGGSTKGCSVACAADERGGAATGAGGGADAAARGRDSDWLLWSAPRPSRQAQALPGAGEARRQGCVPGLLRHRRGGGAVLRAIAGGAGGGGKGGGGGEPGHTPCGVVRRNP